jgi:hypothetical protein
MSEFHPIDPSFNIQVVEEEVGEKGVKVKIATKIEIETALPVVLYQKQEPDQKDQRFEGYVRQFVPTTADFSIWGDEVAIFGKIEAPGRNFQVYARVLRPGFFGSIADIDVSGAAPPKALAKLPVGATWTKKTLIAPRTRAKAGEKGPTGKGKTGTSGDQHHPGGSGQSPEDANDERMHGQAGEPGAPGAQAGEIAIYCERAVRGGAPPLYLRAIGGRGQDGQPGQDGAEGGDGGHGWIFLDSGWATFPTDGGPAGNGGNGGKGGQGGKGGKGGNIIYYRVGIEVNEFGRDIGRPIVYPWGGQEGTPGAGGALGRKGTPGDGGNGPKPGFSRTADRTRNWNYAQKGRPGVDGLPGAAGDRPPGEDHKGNSDVKLVTLPEMAGVWRVTQLQMMFEAVRARYLATDPRREKAKFAEIGEKLAWIDRLLLNYPDNDKALAAALAKTVLSVRETQDVGLDYFGKTPAFMPAVSLATYQTALDGALGYLHAAEVDYLNYFAKLKKAQEAADELGAAQHHIEANKGYMVDKKRATVIDLAALKTQIDEAEEARKAYKENKLDPALKNFAVKVNQAFGLGPKPFVDCLSQLAFIGEKPFNIAAMVTSQVAQLGTEMAEAKQKILNDLGEQVDKNYVLGQIARVQSGSGKELRAEFQKMGDGTISDSASYKSVVQLNALRELCDEFRQTEGAFDAAAAIDHYIELIERRNGIIDFYNEGCRRLVDLDGEVRRCELQINQFDAKRAKEQARLPVMTSLVAGYYERAKTECIREIYMANRAYSFWALEPYEGFYGRLGDPAALAHAGLKDIAEETKRKLLTRLDTVRETKNWFPKLDSDDDALGVLVVMTKESHPEVLRALQINFRTEFELLPSDRYARAPHNDGEPSVEAAIRYSLAGGLASMPMAALHNPGEPPRGFCNPFYGKADVRLIRIRPWLVGMRTKTNRVHDVTITHLGLERFRTTLDAPFPQGEGPEAYVEHLPFKKRVKYNPEGLSYSVAEGEFTPGSFAGLPDIEDGDLDDLGLRGAAAVGGKAGALNALPGGAYAPIGPFGRWRIEAWPKDNGFDKDEDESMLADLSAIVIDFHGFFQEFSS